MSGTYTIDPVGTGARNFKDFGSATYQLHLAGIRGAVTFDVAPGTYVETWSIAPIPGASTMQRVTFRSRTPRGARLKPASGQSHVVRIFDYTAAHPVTGIVFDGFEFASDVTNISQRAISALGACEDWEVRNCTFIRTHIYAYGRTTYGPVRWNVHHTGSWGRPTG